MKKSDFKAAGNLEVAKFECERVRVRVLPDGRMDRRNSAVYLGVEAKTLAQWAWEKRGPRMVHVGGRVFYYQCDLDAFIQGKSND